MYHSKLSGLELPMSSGGIVQVGALPSMSSLQKAVQSGVSDVTRLVTGSSAPKTAASAGAAPLSADAVAAKLGINSFDSAWGVSESDKARIRSDNQWRKTLSVGMLARTGVRDSDADVQMMAGNISSLNLSAQDASVLRANNDFRYTLANAIAQRLSPGAPGASYAITSPSSDTSLFTMPSMQMAGGNKTMLYVGGAVALGALAWFVSKKR